MSSESVSSLADRTLDGGPTMRVVVDLARCQSYGQCVFASPEVFELSGVEVLEYDSAPSQRLRGEVERARAACPVQAITIGEVAGPHPGGERL